MKTFAILFTLSLLLVGCSSTKDKQDVEKKVAQETVTDGAELGKNIQEMLRSSTTLTEKQKEQLSVVFAEARTQNKTLSEESFKLKSVLVKELLSKENKVSEIKILRKKIKKNESLKLKNSLSAIDKITEIMGKSPDTTNYANQLMFMDRIQ